MQESRSNTVKPIVKTPWQHAQRLIRAFGYSCAGLSAAFKNEAAFRLEVYAMFVLLPLALWAPVGAAEKALMAWSALMVPIIELINSAIEAVVDRVGLDHHELSGRAKDIGSAAVLGAIVTAAGVWGICLWPLVGR